MGAAAAREVAVDELGAGLWRLLARAILTASAAPGVEPGIANELTDYFNVKLASQITAASATTIVLQDVVVRNSAFPFAYSFHVGRGKDADGKYYYHAGILVEASFSVKGSIYKYMFVERWKDAIRIRFYKAKLHALQRLKSIRFGNVDEMPSVYLTEVRETKCFYSCTLAEDMVKFAHDELDRKMDTTSFSSPKDLAKMDRTNCIVFAFRAGALLGPEVRDDFLNECLLAVGERQRSQL